MRGKKRHKTAQQQQSQKAKEPLQPQGTTKKFKPAIRKVLILDLIFLAVVQMLTNGEIIGVQAGNMATIVGAVTLLGAMIVQFKE